jgi:predicted Zn-dependent protease
LDRQFESRGLDYNDGAVQEHLAEIGRPFVPRTPMDHVRWQFFVMRDPLVNAFSLANGSIYVNTGMLAILENNDQLAGALAHEMAHVVYRHSYLRIREYQHKQTRKIYTRLALAPLDFLPYGIGLGVSLISAFDRPMAEAALSGYGRAFEREADQFAIDQFSRSGRDARQILRSFQRMAEQVDADRIPTYYSQGIQERRTYLEAAIGNTPSPPSERGDYLMQMRAVIRQNIHLDIVSRRFRSALRGAKRLAAAYQDNAEDLYLEGEAYRWLGPRTEEPSQAELKKSRQGNANTRDLGTEEEAFRALASTPEGKSALQSNQATAERLFQHAMSLDEQLAEPHLGLGMLYDQQGRSEQAGPEYRKYLELAPAASDRVRVERRLNELDRKLHK